MNESSCSILRVGWQPAGGRFAGELASCPERGWAAMGGGCAGVRPWLACAQRECSSPPDDSSACAPHLLACLGACVFASACFWATSSSLQPMCR